MAEKMLLAFGRYLKLVRERRKLSLEDVATLTKSYPEPINKGYLSRVERGLARIGFSKMVALSHAYEVSLDAFGEKLALDLEVDRMRDAPDTRGKTFGELTQLAVSYRQRGMRWHAYAVLRDALSRSSLDPLTGSFGTKSQQQTGATLSFGISVSGLGRTALAHVELMYVGARLAELSEDNRPIYFQQLAALKRRLGLLNEATELASRAVELAQSSPTRRYLGAALEAQALLASQAHREEDAIDIGKRAFAAFKAANQTVDCARMLNNLAQSYFNLGRMKAARRALGSAERLATELNADSVKSRSRILLGEIEMLAGEKSKAAMLWHDALDIARRTHDSVVHFKAEFQLFKLAISQGNRTLINALGRRLDRLSPWIAPTEPEIAEFRSLYAVHRKPKQRAVARSQPDSHV